METKDLETDDYECYDCQDTGIICTGQFDEGKEQQCHCRVKLEDKGGENAYEII